MNFLPYLDLAQKKLGKGKGIVVYAAISLIVVIVARAIYKSIKEGVSEGKVLRKKKEQVDELLDSTSSEDGSDVDDNFSSTASNIADRVEEAMRGAGTNESVIFESLSSLTGAQLRAVYSAFSVRDGQDLFAWFDEELSSSSSWWVVTDDNIEGCTSWFDQCSEREAMVSIWKKSGLNYN